MSYWTWAIPRNSKSGKAHYYHVSGKVAFSLCGKATTLADDLQPNASKPCALCDRSTGTPSK